MPAGRPRLPTELKRVKGTLRPGRVNPAEPTPEIAAPPCPRELTPLARKQYRKAARELKAAGMITRLDLGCLVGYSVALASALRCEAEIGNSGEVIRGKNNTAVASPFALVRQMSLKSLAQFASALGMSPSSRSRVHAVLAAPPEDPFDIFLKKGSGRAPGVDDDDDDRPLN
jgi:P27 family predicted phage terminase small subunit